VSAERYQSLVSDLCTALQLPSTQQVLDRGVIEVGGYEVVVQHLPSDEGAMYLNFDFGIVSAGRTLRALHMMLTSNLTLYAQDQAQLGMDPTTGCLLLIIRVPMTDEIDGAWLADTFTHYSEHGNYWRQNLGNVALDEMYDPAVAPSSHFIWMRA